MKWTEWLPLKEVGPDSIKPRSPGAYRVRGMGHNQRPHPVPQIGGTDREGLLYIGSSEKSIRGRLRAIAGILYRKRERGHPMASHFIKYRLDRWIPRSHLEVSWIATPTRKTAIDLERRSLRRYVHRFGNLPPLNYQLPRKKGR